MSDYQRAVLQVYVAMLTRHPDILAETLIQRAIKLVDKLIKEIGVFQR